MNIPMRTLLARSAALAAALLLATPALAAGAEDVKKPVTLVVNNVRFGKDLKALSLFGTDAQGAYLLGEDWKQGTDAQRKEFGELFKTIFGKVAFPRVRENFKHFGSFTTGEPKVDGKDAHLSYVLLLDHPVKKQEMKLKFTLVNDGGWKVVDVAVAGDSMLKGIREDQIVPIMKEGGWDNLLKLMRAK
ncbi:MAG: ABC transporter substrate-binding protein, partial [Deltaproteobacteria bacterium]|nr:ABC transporter substrate-binding protein [Deltaproteobacteria bacterium]